MPKALFHWTNIIVNSEKGTTVDQTNSFEDFYGCVNVQSYSEAVCDTIGSIMGISMANGRNLMPLNLIKEVFIRFNLQVISYKMYLECTLV